MDIRVYNCVLVEMGIIKIIYVKIKFAPTNRNDVKTTTKHRNLDIT